MTQFGVLGPLHVEVDGAMVPLGPTRQRQLLALLLLRAGETVPVERLMEDLWSGSPPKTARHTVQVYVYRLRGILGTERQRLATRTPGYRLDVAGATVDSVRFGQLVSEGRELLPHDPEAALTVLDEALGLWRGGVLDDLPVLHAFLPEVARLEQLHISASEERLDAALSLGRTADVVLEAEALLTRHPFRERVWAQLMLALYREARQADALAAFQRARAVLGEELGLEPGPALVDLENRILLQDPVLEEGGRGERVAPAVVLPVPRTTFVGRNRELDEVSGLLQRERLMTITGPPGSGKTRLAIEAARAAASEFPHGTIFVSLTEIDEPVALTSSISSALGMSADPRPGLEGVAAFLRTRRILLVVDNVEHREWAPHHLARLLDAAPGLTLLATGRRPLHLSGEQEYPLEPFPAATPEDVAVDPTSIDSLALFADRARSVHPDFELDASNAMTILDIVHRLDGLPLAIELAATRLRSIPLEDLADRLADALPLLTRGAVDAPERHQSLQAAIAWSHDALPSQHRTAFRRLAVFRGGFTADAAAAVIGDAYDEEALRDLVDASLILRPGDHVPARYSMLETVRQFALEELGRDDEREAVARRHGDYFAAFVGRAEPELTGRDQALWLDCLSDDIPNVRVALAWLAAHDPVAGMFMAAGLWRFWQFRGPLAEGRRWLEELLATPGVDDERAIVAGRIGLAGICYWQRDFATAERHYWAALELTATIDDRRLRAEALTGQMTTLACQIGDLDRARPLERELLTMAAESSDSWLQLMAVGASGIVRLYAGDLDGARVQLEMARVMARDLGDRWLEGETTTGLAGIAFFQGGHQEAEALARDALSIAVELRHMPGVAVALESLALAAAAAGRMQLGVTLAAAAAKLRERLGGGIVLAEAGIVDVPDPVDLAKTVLSDEEIAIAQAVGRTESLDAVLEAALEGGSQIASPTPRGPVETDSVGTHVASAVHAAAESPPGGT